MESQFLTTGIVYLWFGTIFILKDRDFKARGLSFGLKLLVLYAVNGMTTWL